MGAAETKGGDEARNEGIGKCICGKSNFSQKLLLSNRPTFYDGEIHQQIEGLDFCSLFKRVHLALSRAPVSTGGSCTWNVDDVTAKTEAICTRAAG